MRAITAKEAKELDSFAIEKLGIPRLALMENAGKETAGVVLGEVGKGKSIVLIAGPGNNGGDGFVAARYLNNAGLKVSAFVFGKINDVRGDAKVNLDIAQKLDIGITEIKDLLKLKQALLHADVVIDAIFGIGFKGSATGIAAKIIDLINEVKKSNPYTVVSVDVPSGLDASSGRVGKYCVKADITVTFAYPKLGLFEYPGSEFAGKIIIADIGIPKVNPLFPKTVEYPRKEGEKQPLKGIKIIDASYVSKLIPKRKAMSHKGSYGSVFIVGGSPGMTGAPLLAGRGSLRSGAGIVRIGVPENLRDITDAASPETITIGLKECESGTLSIEALPHIIEYWQKSQVLALGPGLSTNAETVDLVKTLIAKIKKIKNGPPLIIDADALNAVSNDVSILKNSKTPIIITPHPGELARITKKSTAEIQKKRAETARSISRKLGVVIVLKGAYTIVARPKGEVFLNTTGNPGMASAGMGDVLTGIIASLVAQGVSPFEAALSGVYLHGLAGDISAKIKGEHGLIASDVIEALPYAIKSTF